MHLKSLSVCVFCLFCSPVMGDNEIAGLHDIVVNIQANRGSIVTWEGHVRIADQFTHNSEQRRAEYEAEYTLDRSKETLRWSFKEVLSDTAPDGAKVIEEASPTMALAKTLNSVNGILNKEGLSRIDTRIVGNEAQSLSIQSPRLFTRSYTSWDFDPMYYFDPAGLSAPLRIQSVYDMKDNPYSTWTVSKSGSLITVRSEVNIGLNEYVIDLSSGSNVVTNLMRDLDAAGKVVSETTWNAVFVQVGDIWVPGRVSYENAHHVNKTKYTRLLEWDSQTVNGKLADQAFDLAAIGVRDGFRIVDNRTGTVMDVKDGQVIPRTEHAPAIDTESHPYRILMSLIAVALVSVMIFSLSRRKTISTSKS